MQRTRMSRIAAAVTTLLFASVIAAALIVAFRDAPARRALAASAPENDRFEGRTHWYPAFPSGTDVFPLDATQSTDGATLESGETAPCAPIGATVWFEYTADRDGTVTLDTTGSSFDTVLAAYTFTGDFLPSPPGGGLSPITCDDNSAGVQSRLSFPITRGQQYLIQAGGRGGASGELRVHAECACAPPNDLLVNAIEFGFDPSVPTARSEISTGRATLEPEETRPCGNIGATVWYRMYVPLFATINVSTAGSDFDTVVAAYTADYYTETPAQLSLAACNDNAPGGGAQSSVTLEVRPGQYYYFQAGGASDATGRLVFEVKCVPACPPYNDGFGFDGASELPVLAEVQTEGATTEAGEPLPCGGMGRTVWYGVVVRGDTTIAVDTDGSDFDTVVAAYEQVSPSPPPGSLDQITCKAAAGGAQPRLTFDALANHYYWVQAGGRNGASGLLQISIDCTPGPCPPQNDDSQNTPIFLDPSWAFPAGYIEDTRGATTQPHEQLGCGAMGRTVWVQVYSSVLEVPIVLDTDGSSFDTAIALYQSPHYGAPPIEELTPMACEPGAAGTRASLRFQPTSGATYFVQIGGRNGAGGDLKIRADCVQACPPQNDDVSRAQGTGPGMAFNENTRGATLEAGEEQPCGNIGKTVWFNLPAQGDWEISTLASDFPVAMALYSWEGFSPPGGLGGSRACSVNGSLEVRTHTGSGYSLQVGGVDGAGGALQILFNCTANCPQDVGTPDTGGPCGGCGLETGGGAPGSIAPPETGSGGYLPGARRR